MKKWILLKLLLTTAFANAQPVVQPLASGNYWEVDQYATRLPGVAAKTTFPLTVSFTNGFVGINSFVASRLVGQNEIRWNVGTMSNVRDFVVQWSRDAQNFEQASIVHLQSTANGEYVFRHRLDDNRLVYYRVGIVTGANTIAYTPAVQVLDEEFSTKIYPTEVRGSTVYVQTAQAFEKLQVVNSGGQAVFEKGLSGQTGTLTVGLPALQKGIYFVRLLSANTPQHVQRILVE